MSRLALRRDSFSESQWGATVVAILVGTSVSALADGNYFYASYNWMAIATVVLVTAGLERRAGPPDATTGAEPSLGMIKDNFRRNRS